MKERRHLAILHIIRERPIATQEELAQALAAQGIEVTQATVSRDIRELRLIKVSDGAEYRYAEPPQLHPADAYGKVRRALAEYVLTMERSSNIVVLKTSPGTANAVAAAIDEVNLSGVLATLAGDDVVLVIVKESETTHPAHLNPQTTKTEEELRFLWGNGAMSGEA